MRRLLHARSYSSTRRSYYSRARRSRSSWTYCRSFRTTWIPFPAQTVFSER
jgi:hypothetical protein